MREVREEEMEEEGSKERRRKERKEGDKKRKESTGVWNLSPPTASRGRSYSGAPRSGAKIANELWVLTFSPLLSTFWFFPRINKPAENLI